MADPGAYARTQREVIAGLGQRAHRRLASRIHTEQQGITHLRRAARSLSPLATLDRGYALVTQVDGTIVRDPEALEADELLRVVVAEGDFAVRTVGAPAADDST